MPDELTSVDLEALESMTTKELAQRYEEGFGERCRSSNKQWLLRRVAWRMQFIAGGDMAERALSRAQQLAGGIACDADIRVRPPSWSEGTRGRKVSTQLKLKRDARIPPPGSVLRRSYKGNEHEVRVTDDGFEYGGGRYRSLTAVAYAITGSHWNGLLFFGLGASGGRSQRSSEGGKA